MKTTTTRAIAICGLSLVTATTYAQKGFEIGVRSELQESMLINRSDINSGPVIDYANTMSFLAGGIGATYNINKKIGVEVDVLYSRQGQNFKGTNMQPTTDNAYNNQVYLQAKLNDAITTGDYKAKAELNCIKVPLLFRITSDNSKKIYNTFSFGPQLNILHSAVYEVNKEDVALKGLNITPDDVYRKTTLDGVAALGIGVNLSSQFVFSAQLRVDYGFQDVEKKDAVYSYGGVDNTKYYSAGRSGANNATAGIMLGLNYKMHCDKHPKPADKVTTK